MNKLKEEMGTEYTHLANHVKKVEIITQTLDPIQHILDKLSYDDQCDIVDFFNELEIKNKIEEVK